MVPVKLAKRNKWLAWLARVPLGLAIAFMIATAANVAPLAFVAPHLLALAVFGEIYLRRRNPRPELTDTTATVRDGVLELVSQGIRVPLSDVKNALIVPGSPNPHVLVDRKGLREPLRLYVKNVDDARAVLRLLGYDASQRTLVASAMSWAMASRVRVVGLALGAMGAAAALTAVLGAIAQPFTLLAPFVMIATFLVAAIPSRVTIGGDGILLEWLRRRKFVPIADVLSAVVFDEGMGRSRRVGVQIATRSGVERIVLGGMFSLDKAHALVERIAEVKSAEGAMAIGEAAASGFVAQFAEGALADTRAWLAELRALGAGAMATHRVAPVPPATLLQVVEDPAAPPPARVAAAVALRASGDPDGAARVRVAAETAAHPKLRVALERSVEDDDDALVEAVEGLREKT